MEELTKEERELKEKIMDFNIWIRNLDGAIYNWKRGIRNLGYREDQGVKMERLKVVYEVDGEERHYLEDVGKDQKEALKKMIEEALEQKEKFKEERKGLIEELKELKERLEKMPKPKPKEMRPLLKKLLEELKKKEDEEFRKEIEGLVKGEKKPKVEEVKRVEVKKEDEFNLDDIFDD